MYLCDLFTNRFDAIYLVWGTKFLHLGDKISPLGGQNFSSSGTKFLHFGRTKFLRFGDKISPFGSCKNQKNNGLQFCSHCFFDGLFLFWKFDFYLAVCQIVISYPANRFIMTKYSLQFFRKSLFLFFIFNFAFGVYSI